MMYRATQLSLVERNSFTTDDGIYGGYRYAVHPDRIKAEFPEHPIGHSLRNAAFQ
jgi:hypothetical protein